jgi:hypothetical protein
VDGILRPEPRPNLRDLPPPAQVHGIEVYAGAATMPIQYGTTRSSDDRYCGLIVVWTR